MLFSPAIDIINTLSAASSLNCLDKAIKKYTLPKLLVIDELGYLPIDKLGANLLFQVISKRYETGSILLTGNRAFKECPKSSITTVPSQAPSWTDYCITAKWSLLREKVIE